MRLVVVSITILLTLAYGALVKYAVDAGSILGYLVLLIFPFVLGYFVGDEEDREDYRKLRDWLLRRWRS